jgi:ubiquinone/menaquinone biosynthesis C-methylase UbiE
MSKSNEETIRVWDYDLPVRLARLTGCPPEAFESYGDLQFKVLQNHLDIQSHDFVLEIGCAVGRLAIPVSRIVRPPGGYLGIDIIRDSIDWCSKNITGRFPHFRFHFENVASQIHNPAGSKDPAATVIPLPDHCVDKLFLSSVFTHMFPDGVDNYLREFQRVLKPMGVALSTMFLLNSGSRRAIQSEKTSWKFAHEYQSSGCCWVDSSEYPEGAVAYDEASYLAMIRHHGMDLLKPVIYGTWADLGDPLADGQDYVIFGPSRA